MRYVESNLLNGESVLYRSKIHWIIFAAPAFWTACTVLLVSTPTMLTPLSLLTGILALFFGIFAVIRYFFSEYAVTNRRILMKVGFIQRHSLELFLRKIEAIQVDQGILGRLLGYGVITVVGTGGTQNRFPDIDDPLTFRKQIQRQVQSAYLLEPVQADG